MGDRRTPRAPGTTKSPGGHDPRICSSATDYLSGPTGVQRLLSNAEKMNNGSSSCCNNNCKFPHSPPGRLKKKHQRVKPYQLKDGILLGFLLVTASCVCISTLVLLSSSISSSLSSSHVKTNLLQLIKRHLPRLPFTFRGSRSSSRAAPGGGLRYRGGLYVGLVTSGGTLERAEAVWRTWGAGVSNLTFYADQQSLDAVGVREDMNIFRMPMPRVSPFKMVDIQTKTFHALGNVCTFPDSELERFDWFFMSRDDVYVNVRNMAAMIRTLDPMKKVQAGLGAKVAEEDPSVCVSTPGLLVSRRLLQDVCDYLEQCQQEISVSGAALGISSCIYRQSAVPCTLLPQKAFHRISDDEIKNLFLAEPGHMTEMGKRLEHVVVTWVVPQPWLILQLHALTLLSQLKNRGQALESEMEKRKNMESYLYTSYSGSTLESSIRADSIYTQQGEYHSSHSCGGGSTGHSPNHTQLIEAAAYLLQASNTDAQQRTSNFTFHQIYSANIANRTMASLVDLAVTSVGNNAPARTKRELARVALKMRHQPLRQFSQLSFDKINQLWILLPISQTNTFSPFLEFWREIKQNKLGFAMNLLVLPVNISGVRLSSAIPKEGIYNPNGELRRLISFPNESSSEKQAYSEGLQHVCKNGHPNSAILSISADFRFRPDFLRRCIALTSTGSHYIPVPYTNNTFYHKTWSKTEDVSMETDLNSNKDRRHVVWTDRQPYLKCMSSIICKDQISNRRTVTSKDPDIYWYNTRL